MDSATVEQKLAALKAGEAEVRTQLSELDTKLGAWADAMTHAHVALQASLESAAAAGHEISEPAASVSASETADRSDPGVDSEAASPKPEPESQPEASDEPRTEPEPVPDEPSGQVADEAEREPEGVASPSASAPVQAAEPTPPSPPSAVQGRVPTVPEPAAPPGVSEEDEKLLASLEPEVANQIRVKRRLSGNRRSVRELLAEVESEFRASKPDASPASRNGKRWWRKGT